MMENVKLVLKVGVVIGIAFVIIAGINGAVSSRRPLTANQQADLARYDALPASVKAALSQPDLSGESAVVEGANYWGSYVLQQLMKSGAIRPADVSKATLRVEVDSTYRSIVVRDANRNKLGECSYNHSSASGNRDAINTMVADIATAIGSEKKRPIINAYSSK